MNWNWTTIGIVLFTCLLIWWLVHQHNGIKQLMEKSYAAPQYWGTFAILMLAVLIFIYLLIKL